jgi:CHAT domain-containing protein
LAAEQLYRPWGYPPSPKASPADRRRDGVAPTAAESATRLLLEREVRAEARGDSDRGLLDLALLDLAGGRISRAVTALELAAQRPHLAVAALTNLSAAYLARFEAEGDQMDLLRSARAADAGLRLAPSQPALLFNRAQTLTWLGTPNLAQRAWLDFLARPSAPGWKQEASASLIRLQRPATDDEWRRSLAELQSPRSTPEQIAAIVERFPGRARLFAEEILLPRWADAMSSGGSSEPQLWLELAATIGKTLERERGEALLADATASIRATMADPGNLSHRHALLRGLHDFGYGVAQFNEQNLETARPALLRAARDLTATRVPLCFWARFYLDLSERYANTNRGLALLDGLLGEIPRDRYLALYGRIEWIAGTADKVQGRIQSSVRRYEVAAHALRRSGGDEAAAFVSVLLAESYSLLGQYSLGWRNRSFAFHTVPWYEGPKHNIAMWGEAKGALVRQGGLALAGPFVEEEVAVAQRWGRPFGLATAYVDRATYRLEIGAHDAALSDLREAQRAVSRMEESDLKSQAAYLALVTEGLCYQRTEPAKAASLLRRGLEGQKSTGNRFDAIDYTTAEAAAELAAGQVHTAAVSLDEAIAIFEDIRSTVEDPVARMQAFRRAQPAFDTLIRLRTSAMAGDREAAFNQAERSRARVLLELWTRRGVPGARGEGFATLVELERALPRRLTLVSYVALEDEVLAWVVQRGQSRLVTLKSDRERVTRAIERFRLEVTRRAPEQALRDAGAPLYDMLVRPLDLALASGGTLVFVPDRWLARLPFAALFDRRQQRYLVEEEAVAMAPSATLLLRGSQARRLARPPKLSLVAVAVPRAGSFSGRHLPSLPEAALEAREVAALYARPTLLLGADASRENFLQLSVSTDVMHFAGHAIADLESPQRSVLLFAGRSQEALEPLSLGEILAAGKLATARLVVLSACRTQDSLADDREGLLGLAGAFLAAGVPEVVASPWDVDDQSAAPLMEAFHREYIKGRSAAEAFRQAVLRLRTSDSPELRSPVSWGAFTVIEGLFEKEVPDGL